MSPSRKLLVFTDLDGTLLDHHDYGCEAALPLLERLRALEWPVVPSSSKTASEMRRWRRAVGESGPYVVENGAAIHFPAGALTHRSTPETVEEAVEEMGVPYETIRRILIRLRQQKGYRFRGFGDVDARVVAEWTGLTVEHAKEARMRKATEPLHWEDDPDRLELLRADLEREGLVCVGGGRFVHVMGRTDKGRALSIVTERFSEAQPSARFTTVALGDSPNDLPMLLAAEVAVVIPRTDGKQLSIADHPRVISAESPGPTGWAQVMDHLIERELVLSEAGDG